MERELEKLGRLFLLLRLGLTNKFNQFRKLIWLNVKEFVYGI
ncbi:hypothetical protein MuYL_1270 [Mucilaginibacter xinganensis]|uniref:Uncharacterized protein n=1 Tax=Mucilaginibacter xinganensis TaxID=1234841 RepID=A0A223NU58_9SPHI|nr:hypothetical protein MuYL_1270 [Mucilaginibacter xinganensis]